MVSKILIHLFLFAFAIKVNANSQGEFIAHKASCVACHTQNSEKMFGGGYEIQSPVGLFRTPNISSSPDYGIGSWKFESFYKAIKEGVSPSGQHYFPSFPYQNFTKLTDEDIRAVYDYIMSQPPVDKRSRPHRLDSPILSIRKGVFAWKQAYFRSFRNPRKNFYIGKGQFDESIEKLLSRKSTQHLEVKKYKRGAYLVEAVFHCTMCHTPRRYDPALKKVATAPLTKFWMGGSRGAPNITPSKRFGLGTWTDQDLIYFFRTGYNKDGRLMTSSGMDKVIDQTRTLTQEDLNALIYYLKSLEPVESLDKEDFK